MGIALGLQTLSRPLLPELILPDSNRELPWNSITESASVSQWLDLEGNVCAYGYRQDNSYCIHLPGLAKYYFTIGAKEVFAIAEWVDQTDLVFDAYYRSILPLLLQVCGVEVLHASAVLTSSGVIAFGAISGTGKSTIATGLSRRGYSLWADDAVVVEPVEEKVSSLPIPFEMKLNPDAASFFSEKSDRVTSKERAVESEPLSKLVVLKRLPDQGGTRVKTKRLSSADALSALLTHAYVFDLGDTARKRLLISNYLQIISLVPVFEVAFQAGLENLSLVLDEIEGLI